MISMKIVNERWNTFRHQMNKISHQYLWQDENTSIIPYFFKSCVFEFLIIEVFKLFFVVIFESFLTCKTTLHGALLSKLVDLPCGGGGIHRLVICSLGVRSNLSSQLPFHLHDIAGGMLFHIFGFRVVWRFIILNL